ncbi:MAG: methyltransferase [Candidatus Marinimicrobia bacterium]|nr:methyltransferase [Candidatus Neomarinimicrobiota bacterium]
MAKIFETLESLNLTSKETSELFSNKTRDVSDLNVYKDSSSGVIYIDDFFVGNEEYIAGEYRKKNIETQKLSDQDILDNKRRAEFFEKYYKMQTICDFGCGEGSFLKNTKSLVKKSYGVEIQKNYSEDLNNKESIECYDSISQVPKKINSIFMFHVLEHLEDPIYHLSSIYDHLEDGGKLIVEVPHANDFLIKNMSLQKFIDFTLWSQHLILHTQDSLYKFLKKAQFKNITTFGVQRYPLSNHLYWLSNGLPGGHQTELNLLDTEELNKSYENSLKKIDATDTLIAIAEK